MKTQVPKTDIYARVADCIIQSLEAGTRPWFKPWSVTKDERRPLPSLRGNGMPYRGINVLLLWGNAMDKGLLQHLDDLQAGAEARRACSSAGRGS